MNCFLIALLQFTGDICAIQKAGGEGVMQSDIMCCLRLASRNAESLTKKIKDAVEAYTTERALRKIKRHSTSTSAAVDVSATGGSVNKQENKFMMQKGMSDLASSQMDRLKQASEESGVSQSNDVLRSSEQGGASHRDGNASTVHGGPSSWDPYSKGVDTEYLKASLASRGEVANNKQKGGVQRSTEADEVKAPEDTKTVTLAGDASENGLQISGERTLKDAVKPKNKRKKRQVSDTNAS